MSEIFRSLSIRISKFIGSVSALAILVLALLFTDAWYGFSVGWETDISFALSITTLVVLVFLQKSKNHSDRATHLKLDELIKTS